MELKYKEVADYISEQALLIEPYGIEIDNCGSVGDWNIYLLIEPYGIEIFLRILMIYISFRLLIEPYGIEM